MRFAVINDLHAHFDPGSIAKGYPGANQRAEWMLAQFEEGGAHADVDFVILAGDMIHGENLTTITTEMKAFKDRLDRLVVPYYPVCGNHEIQQAEGNPAYEKPYRDAFGDDRFDYVIPPAAGVEIVVLNNAGTFHVTKERREERYLALKRMLETRPAVPKILVCHVPLVCVRDQAILAESFGFLSYHCIERELLDLIETTGSPVKLVISGHLHLTGMTERKGIKHLATAGTASFPHDYALIEITNDNIQVDVHNLPAELHEPASNIHGPPRYEQGFVDSLHPTAQTYLSGNPEERCFTVRL